MKTLSKSLNSSNLFLAGVMLLAGLDKSELLTYSLHVTLAGIAWFSFRMYYENSATELTKE